jgi:hypothetical protein
MGADAPPVASTAQPRHLTTRSSAYQPAVTPAASWTAHAAHEPGRRSDITFTDHPSALAGPG